MIGLLTLFSVAGALTTVWLGGALIYVSRSMGWSNLAGLPPTDLALFVLGALGPVADLWLVVGFVQAGMGSQRQEAVLRTLAAQARQTAGQTEGQVRTLIQMQQESRRRSLIDGMDLVLKDLNGQAAVLAERLGMVSEDEADTLWSRTVSGDVWAFAYAFLTRAAAYPEFPDLLAERLAQDDISTSALQIFRRRYDMLVTSFEHTDADKVIRDVLEDGPLARVNDLFAQVDARAIRLRMAAPEEPAEPPLGPLPDAPPPSPRPVDDSGHTMARLNDVLHSMDRSPVTAEARVEPEPEPEPEPESDDAGVTRS